MALLFWPVSWLPPSSWETITYLQLSVASNENVAKREEDFREWGDCVIVIYVWMEITKWHGEPGPKTSFPLLVSARSI